MNTRATPSLQMTKQFNRDVAAVATCPAWRRGKQTTGSRQEGHKPGSSYDVSPIRAAHTPDGHTRQPDHLLTASPCGENTREVFIITSIGTTSRTMSPVGTDYHQHLLPLLSTALIVQVLKRVSKATCMPSTLSPRTYLPHLEHQHRYFI